MPSPLSLTGRRWLLQHKHALTTQGAVVGLLTQQRDSDPLTAPRALSDPYLFPEMRRAVERIERAVQAGEKVGIFGDYDADGITGTVQLVRYFRRHGVEPITYLPDRQHEGYGLKKSSIDALADQGVTLLLTVDTGIAAHAEIAHATSRGIDVIVTDHHRVQGGRPPAFAVLHPTVPSPFPNPHLCGAGVAFMLVRALEHGNIWDGIAEDAVLAAIGTIGDVVPLTGENRVLVIHGLKLIDKLPECPLKDLIDSVRQPGKPLTSGDIAFRVVPRINAAGRLDHPSIALNALLDGGEALKTLDRLNGQRQDLVEELTDVALGLVDRSAPFLTVASERFTPGIVGLIAGKLSCKFGRPSLVGSIVADSITASLRSIPAVDVVQALEHAAVQPHLLHYGGHAQAAGCSFRSTNLQIIAAGLSQTITESGLTEDDLMPSVLIDAELDASVVNLLLAKQLASLEPFGAGNAEPTFILKRQTIDNLRSVGANALHLQCRVGGAKAIGFRLGSLIDQLSPSQPVDVACRIGVNSWNGREEVQLVVEDIRATSFER